MARNRIARLTIGAAAIAAASAIGACGSTTGAASAPAQASTNTAVTPASEAAPTQTAAAQTRTTAPGNATPRCGTADLAVSLGAPVESRQAPGQFDVPLTFRNTSSHDCGLYGVPGVDLIGPDDPNGPVYHLTRIDNGVRHNVVTPGKTATATITVLTNTPGSVGSDGSTNWVPTTVKTIPPGQTTPLTAQWPAGLTVLRQDAATHPGSYVNGVLADPA
ncbi:DUF4232 domain-containing protein [Amycolatopsis sp. K13G38]|uniref:DUF4232 domain-containing protein n=1 Tax=Amycolatopsis acididurans TaxID=2724524 RepID=A0ABX1IW90_9PSEU|nr:DUF4232 domain-containing protein [Amycolatopsis acididurans]NKQ51750.1 DUF4232 domain-containing protein [Amycolatopsis acididurans]